MKAPDNLDCFEYRVRLKGGTTRPHLVVGRDGSGRNVPVVLKLKDPGVSDGHYGGSSLAAELICSLIASEVGLWTPTPYIARVSNEFAENCPDGNVRALFLRNVGLNFACEYLEDCLAWSDPRTSVSEELRQQLEDLLSFDAAVINGDRKAEKPNLLRRGDTLVAIDHSLALPVHLWGDEEAAAAAGYLFPEGQVKAHSGFRQVAGRHRKFAALLEKWRTHVGRPTLRTIRSWLPTEWEQASGDIGRIFAFLEGREQHLAEIGSDLRRITS